MIEISHKQAQHLIREAQDRRLPEEQWAILYAHLENCPECSAYRQHLSSYERDLHRSLQARWGAARGPNQGIADRIIQFRIRRKKAGKILRRGAVYLLGILLLVGYIRYREATAPVPAPLPSATPKFGFGTINTIETVSPASQQSAFRDLVVFESHRDGNAEIYLLNGSPSGVQLTNLTQDPSQDTQPTWSPDGQWIAFLSDRSGKNEVYIIHVAGSRLTQLTNNPDIEWTGPLAWSYDGKWLGLSGRKGGLNGPSFLYLVPLVDPGQPSSIAYTYLADHWLRFSPGQPALAYLSTRRPGGIDVINTETGKMGAVTLPDNRNINLTTGQGGAFDWSSGGGSLVYLVQPTEAEQPAGKTGSQIRITENIVAQSRQDFNKIVEKTIDSLPLANRVRAVSWMPNGMIVASLVAVDAPANTLNECWMIRLSITNNPAISPRMLPDICVTGGLEQANWSPDGKWLVVVGRRPSEQTSAIYALRLPEFTDREDTSREETLPNGSTYLERLAELPAPDLPDSGDPGSQATFIAEPHVRPGGQLMKFIPRTIPLPESTPEPLTPPAQTPGWIAYRVQKGADSWIVRSRPDGSGYLFLTESRGEHSCPRISPDRSRVAYLSDDGSSPTGINEVFITGLDRKNTRQLTHNAFPVGERVESSAAVLPRYACPVWSPDSKFLAAVLHTTDQWYLAVMPIDEQAPVRYLQIEAVSEFAPPVWVPADPRNPTAGSSQILLIYPHTTQLMRLVSVDINSSENLKPANTVVKEQFYLWDDVQQMVISPDGKRLAVSLVFQNTSSGADLVNKATAKLEVIDMASMQALSDIDIPNYDPDTAGLGGLTWLPDGTLEQARIDALIGLKKTLFERFDPGAGRLQTKFQTLASFDEVTYHSVWIEGRWAVFASESGLWVVNLAEAQAKHAAPAMLSGESITDVDWR